LAPAVLKDLVPSDRYVEEILQLPQPIRNTRAHRPQAAAHLEVEYHSQPAIRRRERFLMTPARGIRFVAVTTVFARGQGTVPALLKALPVESHCA
jgi:hypothetical protein